MTDTFLFIAIPYAAVVLAVGGGILRYRYDRFSFSSQSSQLLENRTLFWGSNAWHYGILLVLFAHLAGLLATGAWAALIANPTRLYTLEAIGLGLAFLAFFGLSILILRRLTNAWVASVTSRADWLLLVLLLAQVGLGIYVTVVYRWGSDWYLHTAVPWLTSLAQFQPRIDMMTVLPWAVKAHALGGFLILFLFPFTRLVHVVTVPLSYIWRPYQLVIWNRRPKSEPSRLSRILSFSRRPRIR
ncbi:MAG: respiratory nitrate reductase subunit gamma [Solirubrobacterales bacterium]|nr:respiratory nitrate reductase subunit gamma [Solirubrobacterales bacterium]